MEQSEAPLNLTEEQQRRAMEIVCAIALCDEAEENHIVLGNPEKLYTNAVALLEEIEWM